MKGDHGVGPWDSTGIMLRTSHIGNNDNCDQVQGSTGIVHAHCCPHGCAEGDDDHDHGLD